MSCWWNMAIGQRDAAGAASSGKLVLGLGALLLGIDTCGPTGSVALGRFAAGGAQSPEGGGLEILAEIALEGRSYSSTLVTAVGDLLKEASASLTDIGAIVAVNGPGSFTGVRVGLSAVKGLAEVSRIPVAAVSRLEVLAAKACVCAAALDAHRGEIFLRIVDSAGRPRPAGAMEMLAGAAELKAILPVPEQVAVCDEAAATLLESAWPTVAMLHATPATAADALKLVYTRRAAVSAAKGAVVDIALSDLALLDGNYLRRSDAEIFGGVTEAKRG